MTRAEERIVAIFYFAMMIGGLIFNLWRRSQRGLDFIDGMFTAFVLVMIVRAAMRYWRTGSIV